MTDTVVRLMIADQHPIVRQGLAALLSKESDIRIVAVTDTAPSTITAFREHRPDVVLIDLCLRRGETVEALRTIRGEFPEARFIIFTGFDGVDEVLLVLKSKLQGYLLKTATPDEILECIRAAGRGKRWISPQLTVKLGNAAAQPMLTEREREVLVAVGSGKTNLEVARSLFISEGTVKFHINNILTKLGAADRTEAVVIGLQRLTES